MKQYLVTVGGTVLVNAENAEALHECISNAQLVCGASLIRTLVIQGIQEIEHVEGEDHPHPHE